MWSKDELNKNNIKNRACYFFNCITKDTDINFSDILLDKYENISVYDILYKTSMAPNPLRISFDKIDVLLGLMVVNLDI